MIYFPLYTICAPHQSTVSRPNHSHKIFHYAEKNSSKLFDKM